MARALARSFGWEYLACHACALVDLDDLVVVCSVSIACPASHVVSCNFRLRLCLYILVSCTRRVCLRGTSVPRSAPDRRYATKWNLVAQTWENAIGDYR